MFSLALLMVACKKPVTLSFDKGSETVEVEKSIVLAFSISDETLELEWSSDKKTVATVDQTGEVTGVSVGSANITVKVKDKDVSATIAVTVTAKPVVNPTSVLIENAVESGKVGQSFTFKAKVLPVGADQSVTWKSDNTNVVTVSNTGVVTLVGVGTTTITATSVKDPSKKFEVDINSLAPDPTSITITTENNVTQVDVFSTVQFTAKASPDLASSKVTWTVSDDALASIDEKGLLTAKQPGTVTVTATSTVVTTVKKEFEITIVRPEPTELTVTGKETRLEKGQELQLTTSVQPASAIQDVVFSSSDEAVATVDATGKVVAVGAGTVVITIKSQAKESVFKEYEITVIDVSLIDYSAEVIILDASITALKYEKITIDSKDYYVGLNAFTSAAAAFLALEENSVLIVKAGTYAEATTIKVNGVKVYGPNRDKPAGKDLSNRVDEAIFSKIITLDGVNNILFDGIALTNSAQIKSLKPVQNITILNLKSYSPSVPAGEGIIYGLAPLATDVNENYVVKNSAFVDGGLGYRAIRINNVKNLEVSNNYFFGFFDTIRLEGENNAGLGSGAGISGNILIQDNVFEDNTQYSIWIGAYHSVNMNIVRNNIGVKKDLTSVYGFVYIAGFRDKGVKSVINVLYNEMPYRIADWHQLRFNSTKATPEQLEINVNYNVFHEEPGNDEGVAYFHIADHYRAAADAVDTGFRINGINNYYLYEGEVKADYFLGTNYEPYFTETTPNETRLLVDPNLNVESEDMIFLNGFYYKAGVNAFNNITDALAKLLDGSTLIFMAGTYPDEFAITKNNVTILGPNKGIKADKLSANRVGEAVFSNIITISGTDGTTIDGIKLVNKGQIKSVGGVKNVLIQNVLTASKNIASAEGAIYFAAATAAILNENITIKNNSIVEGSEVARLIRINNPKNLYIENNYLYGSFDAIRLESQGNAGQGVGDGARGDLRISNNIFENCIQYPIWVGAFQSANIEINYNVLGVKEGYDKVFGFIYVIAAKNQVEKSVVNVLYNDMPHRVYDWHELRFNSNGATPEKLEINVNFNIFHESPRDDAGVSYFHIANHYATPGDFKINGANNYFLYEGEVKPGYFLNVNYEPALRELPTELPE